LGGRFAAVPFEVEAIESSSQTPRSVQDYFYQQPFVSPSLPGGHYETYEHGYGTQRIPTLHQQ
jgi:hypothetical protein